jgi:hypothetical protein
MSAIGALADRPLYEFTTQEEARNANFSAARMVDPGTAAGVTVSIVVTC